MASSRFCCSTRMPVITAMMENTPTNTPRMVNDERRTWVLTALAAIRTISMSSRPGFMATQNEGHPPGSCGWPAKPE